MTDRFDDPPILASAKARRGGRRRQLSPEQRAEIDRRLEEIRVLMSLNYSDADLKRMLAPRWGMKPRSVARWITAARQRQRQLLGRSEGECKADSLGYWSREQQEAKRRAAKAREALDAAEAVIRETDAVLADDAPAAAQEVREIALERQRQAVRRAEHARRTVWSAEARCDEIQDRIDKLLGNHAPVKVARTDAAGQDVPEPSDPDAEIAALLAAARSRETPGLN